MGAYNNILEKIENSDDIDFLKGLEARIYESYSMEEINNFEKEELIERLLRKIYFEIPKIKISKIEDIKKLKELEKKIIKSPIIPDENIRKDLLFEIKEHIDELIKKKDEKFKNSEHLKSDLDSEPDLDQEPEISISGL